MSLSQQEGSDTADLLKFFLIRQKRFRSSLKVLVGLTRERGVAELEPSSEYLGFFFSDSAQGVQGFLITLREALQAPVH